MNSIEFIKYRILNGYTDLNIEDYNKLTELNFQDTTVLLNENIKNMFKDNKINFYISYDNKERNITIEYDPEEKFEYFTMESCVCDGTLSFLTDLIIKIFNKLFRSETYRKENIPIDYIENTWDYDVKYIVGDFVVNNEYGEFGTDEKPWLNSRFSVFLPIKFECIKR